MKKKFLILIVLLTLCSCTDSKGKEYVLRDESNPISIWVSAKRYQNDELTISVTARHTPEYRSFANAIDTFSIARNIFVIDENYNPTQIGEPVEIGMVTDFLNDKYDFRSSDVDTVAFNDTFTTEYGEYVVLYEIVNAEHNPRDNGFAFYPAVAFGHSSKGYTIHLPEERISKK